MSETRELRDRLERTQVELRQSKEALTKLRAHYARERESLERQLEQARREVAELRARLEPTSAPPPPPPVAEPAPMPMRSESFTLSTGLLALMRVPSLEDEEALGRLGRTLRMGLVDLRLRLGKPPPVVLARMPLSEARLVRDSLRAEGFAVVSGELLSRLATPLGVRRFSVGPTGLALEGERGERREVRWEDVRLLLPGKRLVATTRTETETVKDGFNRGPRTREVTVREDDVHPFLWAYGEGLWLSFTRDTDFAGLGARRELSAFDNMRALVELLRERAPRVVVDERLAHTPRLSLPLVDPERAYETAGELLWQSVLDGLL
ncbi:coiled-coil domain-containing protein [Melittangium boletus]|uniref:coiled-coil domain-containing protein n=1 Tax=Melittangium boletus TaxID=83453 RepID=UPI003DA20FF1